jgi:hypothetical protein
VFVARRCRRCRPLVVAEESRSRMTIVARATSRQDARVCDPRHSMVKRIAPRLVRGEGSIQNKNIV